MALFSTMAGLHCGQIHSLWIGSSASEINIPKTFEK